MDLVQTTLRLQRITIYGAVVGTALAFWTGAPDTFGLPKATILWLAATVLVALGSIRAAWGRSIVVPRSPWPLALAALAVAALVTTLTSDTPMLSLIGEYNRYTGLLSYSSFAIIGWATVRSFDVEEAATTLRLLTAVLGVVAVYALVQDAGADPFDLPTGLGEVSTLGNANLLAGYLAIATAGAVWTMLSSLSPRWERRAAAGAIVVGLVANVRSDSFQGPVAAAVGATVVLAAWLTTGEGMRARSQMRDRLRVPLRLQPVVAGALLVLAAVAASPSIRSGLRSGFVERGDFWRAAVSMFESDPVLGAGFDSYGQHFLAHRPVGHAVQLGSTQAESAHNVPLNLLAGGGFLVAIPYLALVAVTAWALVRGLRRLDGEERLLLGGLGGAWAAYVVQSIVSFDVPQLGVLHVVLAAAIIAIGVPPRWMSIRLPGTAVRRGRGAAAPLSTSIAVVAVSVASLFAAWHLTRPLRADLAAGDAGGALGDGDIEAAASSLERATSLAPWQGRYHLLLAQVDERRAEVFRSVDDAEEAARREPGSSRYALLAAQLNVRYRDVEDAAPWFEAALERDPHNPDVLGEVAAFLAPRDLDRAGELARRATETAPQSWIGWYGLGVVLEAEGDEDGARAAYERSSRLLPEYGPARDALRRLDGVPVGG